MDTSLVMDVVFYVVSEQSDGRFRVDATQDGQCVCLASDLASWDGAMELADRFAAVA